MSKASELYETLIRQAMSCKHKSVTSYDTLPAHYYCTDCGFNWTGDRPVATLESELSEEQQKLLVCGDPEAYAAEVTRMMLKLKTEQLTRTEQILAVGIMAATVGVLLAMTIEKHDG